MDVIREPEWDGVSRAAGGRAVAVWRQAERWIGLGRPKVRGEANSPARVRTS